MSHLSAFPPDLGLPFFVSHLGFELGIFEIDKANSFRVTQLQPMFRLRIVVENTVLVKYLVMIRNRLPERSSESSTAVYGEKKRG
jgi:hypothetical protein